MVKDKVFKMVAEQFMVEEDTIVDDISFTDDLGADSLDIVELTMALEEEFSLPDTPDEELLKIHTVGDLAEYISRVTGKD